MISINFYEIVMQMVNFLILLFLLNKFLIKPLAAFMEKRAEGLKSDIETAENNKKESEQLLQDQKALLREARTEAKQIRDKADEVIVKEKQIILTEARKEAEDVLVKAKKEISLNMDKAKKDLLSEVGELSVMLAEKVLSKKIDSSEKSAIVSEGLSKLNVS